MKTYKIETKDEQGNTNILEITSTDIEWSMKQYARNRELFTWEIKEEKETCECAFVIQNCCCLTNLSLNF